MGNFCEPRDCQKRWHFGVDESKPDRSSASCGDYGLRESLDSHGVPDTACRKSLIGESVLGRMSRYVERDGNKIIRVPGMFSFRFGNSEVLTSHEVAVVPCRIADRRAMLKLSVLPGKGAETPLLMSKELLKNFGAMLDANRDCMTFRNLGEAEVPLGVTDKGHYAVPLFDSLMNDACASHTHTCTSAQTLSSSKTLRARFSVRSSAKRCR